MDHRKLVEMYVGAARYRAHLEKICKEANRDWRVDSADILKKELHTWQSAFETLDPESLLYYQHVVEAAWEYSRSTRDAAFAQSLLGHMYAMANRGSARIQEVQKNNEQVSPENFKALRAITDHLAEISSEVKKGVQ